MNLFSGSMILTSIAFLANNSFAFNHKTSNDKLEVNELTVSVKYKVMLEKLIRSKFLIRSEENPDLLVLNPALSNVIDGDEFEYFDVDEIEKTLPTAARTTSFSSN